jgi:hypothetical protein
MPTPTVHFFKCANGVVMFLRKSEFFFERHIEIVADKMI